MIAIIDYDAGNIKSVEKALNYLGEEAIITRDHDEIVNSDKVILPGVGAFADAMEKIRHYGLEETILEVVEKNIPFLGICLGLQLMFESSDEGPGVKGLGLLPGSVVYTVRFFPAGICILILLFVVGSNCSLPHSINLAFIKYVAHNICEILIPS